MNKFLAVLFLLLAFSLPASGQAPAAGSLSIPISLSGLLGGLLGTITGQLNVSFESVDGLTSSHLGANTQLISLLDTLLSGRVSAALSLLTGFPVLARIEPTPAGGLAFTGVTTVEMVTASIPLLSGSPRLFTAPVGGGTFQDITTSLVSSGSGANRSYRVQGTSGGFSEFLVVLDTTPVDTAIGSKLDRLDSILAANSGAMPTAVQSDLAAQLATVRSHSAAGSETTAISDLDTFIASVRSHAGADIPNLWRSARDVTNVAGQLIAAAQTLQFSLHQRQGS
jgi:hypothetical protein